MKQLISPKTTASNAGKPLVGRVMRQALLLSTTAWMVSAFTPSASATVLYWDSDGAGSSALGGSGTWDTSSLLWRSGATTGSLVAYVNTALTGTARLGGTAGTLTIKTGTTINANQIIFSTSGYTIAGADSTSILNLDGTTPTITIGDGSTQTISATIAGSAGLTKAWDNGTLVLAGANTYTGATTINGGNLVLDMNAGGSLNSASTLTLGATTNSGNFVVKGKDGVASSQTLGALTGGVQATMSVIKLTPGASGGTVNLTLDNSWNRGGAGSTLNIDLSAGNATLTSSPTLQYGIVGASAGTGGWATVTDSVSTGFATVVGGNVVRYTGASTLTTTTNTGTTNYVTKVGDTGYVGNTLTFGSGNRSVNTLQLDSSAGAGALDLNTATLTLTNRAVLMTGNNDYTVQNGQLGTSGAEVIIHQYGTGALTVNARIGAAGTRLTKDGSGLLILGGTNTYTAVTALSGGTLRANEGIGLSSTSQLTISNGVLETGVDFTRTFGSSNGNNVLIVGGTSGFSAYGGAVNIVLGGTAAPSAITWGSTQFAPIVLVLNESTANNTLNFQNALNLNGLTRTVNVNSTNANAAATISGLVSGTGGLIKGGAGTLVLSNANTYTGATSVTAGKLVVSGTIGGTTTVSSGATLAGGANTTSTLGALVANAGSIVLPGNNGVAGTLNTGAVTFAATSHFGIDLGVTSDQLATTAGSAVTVSLGGVTLDITLLSNFDSSINNGLFLVINNQNSLSTLSGQLASGTSQIVVGTQAFNVLYNANFDAAGNLVSTTDGNDLALQAVPEPQTWAMLLGGIGLLAFGQRLRRRQNA
jgi:autotransporter-associated beta strand protein